MARTVTVACKMPNGLTLRLFAMEEHTEPVMGGGHRTFQKAVDVGARVVIAGTATPFGSAPKAEVVGGYALTRNVDADFFAKWMEQNKDSALVRNKLIFAHAKTDTARGAAAEMAETRSGLEPLMPDTDPRIPKNVKTAAKAA
jgi:hypothetical protein